VLGGIQSLAYLLQKLDIERYFEAEKTGSFCLLILGALACAVACVLGLWLKSKWSIGLAIPLAVIGVVQLAVGAHVMRSVDKLRTDAVYAFDLDPNYLRNQEVPRMTKVMNNFVYYKNLEIGIFIMGVVIMWISPLINSNNLWNGLAWGMCIQSCILLVFDFLAAQRAETYLESIQNWLQR
jgi:hypothetical protein